MHTLPYLGLQGLQIADVQNCCGPGPHAVADPQPGRSRWLDHRGLECDLRRACDGHDNPSWRHIHRIRETRVQIIPGVSCSLQPGTAIATFTRTRPGTYAGHANVWSENTCTINGTTSMTLALSSDGNTLVATQAHGLGILPNVIFTRIQGAHQ
jgi:hypothetical protein